MDRFFGYKPILAVAGATILVLYTFTEWGPPPSSTPPAVAVMPLGALEETIPTAPPSIKYAEVTDGCGPHYEGTCVNMRSGPGVEFPPVMLLRTGMVLKVASIVVGEDGRRWYKIGFDGWIRYPERVTGDWYVSADYVRLFEDANAHATTDKADTESNKRIVIDRTKQLLYAYEGDTLFMQEPISTGLEFTPTPRGTFWVYKKMPDSYMQGPLPDISDQYYDLPGVPWDLYFTYQGGAIHGAYWHNNFGQPWSHGCVNLAPEQAKKLYMWADLGTPVTVRD